MIGKLRNWLIIKLGGRPLNIPKGYTERVKFGNGEVMWFPKGFW